MHDFDERKVEVEPKLPRHVSNTPRSVALQNNSRPTQETVVHREIDASMGAMSPAGTGRLIRKP